MLAQLFNTGLGSFHAFNAFKREWFGDYRYSQNAHFFGDLSYHWSCSSTGTTTHAGSNEHHIGTINHVHDALTIFQCSLTADIRVGTRAQTFRDISTQLQLGSCRAFTQCLGIGIGTDEVYALNLVNHHVFQGVTATTADTDYFDDGVFCICINQFKSHSFLPLKIVQFDTLNDSA